MERSMEGSVCRDPGLLSGGTRPGDQEVRVDTVCGKKGNISERVEAFGKARTHPQPHPSFRDSE